MTHRENDHAAGEPRYNWIARRWHAARKWTTPERLQRVRTYLFQGYIMAALAAFTGLAMLASTTPVFGPDVAITRNLQDKLPAWAGGIMQAVSWPGYAVQSSVLICMVAGIMAALGLRREAAAALFAAASSTVINTLFKVIISRPRPGTDLVHVFRELNSYSFPSGHVMFYTTFFGFILFLSFTTLKRSWRWALANTVLILLIALVGVSRIYLGEHWTSDVLGGYLLGSLLLALTINFYRWETQTKWLSPS